MADAQTTGRRGRPPKERPADREDGAGAEISFAAGKGNVPVDLDSLSALEHANPHRRITQVHSSGVLPDLYIGLYGNATCHPAESNYLIWSDGERQDL
ncbi:MAG: hypothetical protein E6Q97_29260 [Desulfurellales bacterium]|nr:MAG: hypothetical protein E6Q97_29260 [Desulfurellales bacterium]